MPQSISQNAVEFDVRVSNQDALSKLVGDMNKLKGIDTDGADPFKGIKKSAQKATEDINKMTGGIKNNQSALKNGTSISAAFAAKLKEAANVSFEKLKNGLKSVQSALGSGVKKTAGYVVKGTAAAAAGVGALVAQSVKAYADTEQLIGGVETLFKGNAGTVLNDANNAFKTTGLSANDYMETVTSFSASLVSSLKGDTEKAAALSNKALVDMSDNANKMGTDMTSIQNAYQGFAKQNYTMLDNLKLGYGGTQEEMKRLLKDASALKKAQGKNVSYSINKFSDIIEAIHTVQENMDITGTTMKEAESTISGSLNMLKASWKDTLSSLVSGDGDFDRCIDNLIYSAGKFGTNVIPAIEKALGGVGQLIERGAPIIADKFPTLAQNLLPPLIKAASSVVSGFIKALPTLLGVIVDELPGVLKELGGAIADTFGDAFPILKTFGDFISQNSDKIGKCIPVIIGLALAFKAFGAVKSAGDGLVTFVKPLKTLKDKLSGGTPDKLKEVADGTMSAGNAASGASGNLLESAKAFALMGVGVLLICAGFALLTQSAIALANAGPLAIGVMVGFIAVIAALAIGAAALGPALTAGEVGFIAFGAAILLVGAGALLAAVGLMLVSSVLPVISEYGLMGALSIAALGASLMVFAAGSLLAGVGAITLGAGLTVAAVGIAVFAASMLLAVASFTIFSAILTVATALIVVFAASAVALAAAFAILGTATPVFADALGTLPGAFGAMLIPSVALLAALAPLTVEFAALSLAAAVLAPSMSSVAGSIIMMSMMLPVLLAAMSAAPDVFEGMLSPTEQLFAVSSPLAAAFVTLANAAVTLANAILVTSNGMLTALVTMQLMPKVITTAFSAMEKVVNASCTKLVTLCRKCANNIKSVFSSMKLSSSGQNAMQGLINGMESKRMAVMSKARDIANAAARAINEALQIHSPSRVTMNSGEYSTLGLAKGMENKLPVLERTSQRVAATAVLPVDEELAAYSMSDSGGASTSIGGDDITVAPVFNLTINGAASDDDRQTARKVRGWVKDEFENILNSMNRRSTRTQYI